VKAIVEENSVASGISDIAPRVEYELTLSRRSMAIKQTISGLLKTPDNVLKLPRRKL
jgi:hypothetical protein